MEIRKMTIEDSKRIQDFSKFDDFWTTAVFQQDIAETNAIYYLAEEGKDILAILGANQILDIVEIRNIAVRKEKRGQGIGTKLLACFIQEMKQKAEVTRIELEVSEKNEIAILLYQKQGFQMVGRRPKYYGTQEDAILMNLEMKN